MTIAASGLLFTPIRLHSEWTKEALFASAARASVSTWSSSNMRTA